jgi:predicted ATP-dependent serine protease
MNDKVTIRRLATGVPGLDAILGGGLPEFSFNLIVGPPGSGKTTLAHQIMFALAAMERPALGHSVGDQLLQSTAKRLEGCVHMVVFTDRNSEAHDAPPGNASKAAKIPPAPGLIPTGDT